MEEGVACSVWLIIEELKFGEDFAYGSHFRLEPFWCGFPGSPLCVPLSVGAAVTIPHTYKYLILHAITNTIDLGGLQTTEVYISWFCGLGSPGSWRQPIWYLVRASWLIGCSFPCVLTWQKGQRQSPQSLLKVH